MFGFAVGDSGKWNLPASGWATSKHINGISVPLLKQGLSISSYKSAFDELFAGKQYALPCFQAAMYCLIAGGLKAGYQEPPGYYSFKEQDHLPDNDWVPGDWGWIKKTKNVERGTGYEGENLIYIGNSSYWGHGFPPSKTLEQWLETVGGWDPNTNPGELKKWRKWTPVGIAK